MSSDLAHGENWIGVPGDQARRGADTFQAALRAQLAAGHRVVEGGGPDADDTATARQPLDGSGEQRIPNQGVRPERFELQVLGYPASQVKEVGPRVRSAHLVRATHDCSNGLLQQHDPELVLPSGPRAQHLPCTSNRNLVIDRDGAHASVEKQSAIIIPTGAGSCPLLAAITLSCVDNPTEHIATKMLAVVGQGRQGGDQRTIPHQPLPYRTGGWRSRKNSQTRNRSFANQLRGPTPSAQCLALCLGQTQLSHRCLLIVAAPVSPRVGQAATDKGALRQDRARLGLEVPICPSPTARHIRSRRRPLLQRTLSGLCKGGLRGSTRGQRRQGRHRRTPSHVPRAFVVRGTPLAARAAPANGDLDRGGRDGSTLMLSNTRAPRHARGSLGIAGDKGIRVRPAIAASRRTAAHGA
mmetsp:Transcript_116013/g.369053  ORF Transcript_116013/g.369053 Transcript_116013/m.369053 type:complete len:411 (-) Transcript_116013:51-1283(-)